MERRSKGLSRFTRTGHNNLAKKSSSVVQPMLRLLGIAAAILVMADRSFAQSSPDPTPDQCRQIKEAVAQYGYAAARRHALENYGPEAVRVGDKCLTNQPRARGRKRR